MIKGENPGDARVDDGNTKGNDFTINSDEKSPFLGTGGGGGKDFYAHVKSVLHVEY